MLDARCLMLGSIGRYIIGRRNYNNGNPKEIYAIERIAEQTDTTKKSPSTCRSMKIRPSTSDVRTWGNAGENKEKPARAYKQKGKHRM